MVIKREKKEILKEVKKNIPYEDSYDKFKRERREKEVQEINDKKQKELDAAKELERKEDIIFPYLDNLVDQISEKKSWTFWAFPDRTGFKRYKHLSPKEMQKMINEDIDKYKNRNIVYFQMCPYHRAKKDSFHRSLGTLFYVNIVCRTIDNDGNLTKNDKRAWGCTFVWQAEDFKTTKFSFKLLETIMYPIAAKKKICYSLGGTSITTIIRDLEKKKFDFSDVLNPLAGV